MHFIYILVKLEKRAKFQFKSSLIESEIKLTLFCSLEILCLRFSGLYFRQIQTKWAKKKNKFRAFFHENVKFEKFISNVNQKTRKKPSSIHPLSVTVKPISLLLRIVASFSKIDENLEKKRYENVIENNGDRSTIQKILDFDKSLEKPIFKNFF